MTDWDKPAKTVIVVPDPGMEYRVAGFVGAAELVTEEDVREAWATLRQGDAPGEGAPDGLRPALEAYGARLLARMAQAAAERGRA